MKRGNNLVYVNNSSRSYLDLPLSNFVIGIRNVSLNIPENFKLYQNYPNPFNPYTKIKFAVPVTVTSQTSNIRIDVFDVLGRQVELLVNDHLKPGTYEIDFNGSKYSSGVYFYRLTVQNEKMQTPLYSQTLKMILLK
jgi:hypothetical protein